MSISRAKGLIVETFLYILMILRAHTFVCGTDAYINRQPSHLRKTALLKIQFNGWLLKAIVLKESVS